MARRVYTERQRDHAQLLLQRAATWTRATRKRDGLHFVIFPSSRSHDDPNLPSGYYTTETACTCPSYFYRGGCAHVLAVQQEAEAAREAAAVTPRVSLDALLDNHLVDAF